MTITQTKVLGPRHPNWLLMNIFFRISVPKVRNMSLGHTSAKKVLNLQNDTILQFT
jgi:hypothetical protein